MYSLMNMHSQNSGPARPTSHVLMRSLSALTLVVLLLVAAVVAPTAPEAPTAQTMTDGERRSLAATEEAHDASPSTTSEHAERAARAHEAFALDIGSAAPGDEERSFADLSNKDQKKLNKLVAKWRKTNDKVDIQKLKIKDLKTAVADAVDRLEEALEMPEDTAAEFKARKKAIKKASKQLGKARKKLAKAQKHGLALLAKQASLVAAIEEIDPDYFDAQGPDDDDPDDPDDDDPDDPEDGDPNPGPDPVPDPDDPPPDFNGSGITDKAILIHEAVPNGSAGVSRADDVATFGVPFAKGQVGFTDGRPALAVSGATAYQFRGLALWPDNSVKWALCDVQTDIDAGQTVQGLVILDGDGASSQSDIGTQKTNEITLDTGPLRATIRRDDFRFLESVSVDGQLVVNNPSGTGLTGTDTAGKLLVPGPSTSVVLEENGPVRALVRVDGPLVDVSGTPVIDVTLRIIARRGSRELETQLTVRNANVIRPQHTTLRSIELGTQVILGNGRKLAASRHDGVHSADLSSGADVHLYMAHTSAKHSGDGANQYDPHLPYSGGSWAQQGYELVVDGSTVHGLGQREQYPRHAFLDVWGNNGGANVAFKQMAYMYPAALEASGDGRVTAGFFTDRNPADYTWIWQQHESRTAVFSFHTGQLGDPQAPARRLDHPVAGRFADYRDYDRARVFPYRLLSESEQEQALSLMGINHDINVGNGDLHVTRYLYKGTTGGPNNHAGIEVDLGGDWLRHGSSGSYLSGLDLALYKSEWQILRSDNFEDDDAPGATNNDDPHTTGSHSDDEHRYRDGIILAYYLTGDRRLREALFDEAEALKSVDLWQHERSMYMTLRAMALVGAFTGEEDLIPILQNRLEYITQPTIDIESESGGWGWEAAPDQGERRYFVNSSDNKSEKPPGENFQCRGFMSASLGTLGYYHAAEWLGTVDPMGVAARGRMRDLSWWTRHELFPDDPNPANQRLAYSYAVTLQQVTNWENVDFHPFLLGMAESYLDTNDTGYLVKGSEQLKAADVHGDLYRWNTRLDVQHFLKVYRDWEQGQ